MSNSAQIGRPIINNIPIYSGLGEKQQAFEWLEKAYEARDSNLVRIKVSPLMDNLRSDLRFTAFLKKMGFEE